MSDLVYQEKSRLFDEGATDNRDRYGQCKACALQSEAGYDKPFCLVYHDVEIQGLAKPWGVYFNVEICPHRLLLKGEKDDFELSKARYKFQNKQ